MYIFQEQPIRYFTTLLILEVLTSKQKHREQYIEIDQGCTKSTFLLESTSFLSYEQVCSEPTKIKVFLSVGTGYSGP